MSLFRRQTNPYARAAQQEEEFKRTKVREARPKSFLVLGSTGHGREVTSYAWDKLPSGLNVADYDVVIINFAAFEKKTLAEGFPPERLPSRETMTQLAFSPRAEVVAIGDPRLLVGAPPASEERRLFDQRQRAD